MPEANMAVQQGIDFIIAQGTSAYNLFQQNVLWLAVIGGLTWGLSEFGLSHIKFLPKGLFRYFVAFLIVMFFSGIWIGVFQGFVEGA